MEHGILIILAIPIAFFFGTLGYHIGSLFFIWIKYKLQTLKELKIWD